MRYLVFSLVPMEMTERLQAVVNARFFPIYPDAADGRVSPRTVLPNGFLAAPLGILLAEDLMALADEDGCSRDYCLVPCAFDVARAMQRVVERASGVTWDVFQFEQVRQLAEDFIEDFDHGDVLSLTSAVGLAPRVYLDDNTSVSNEECANVLPARAVDEIERILGIAASEAEPRQSKEDYEWTTTSWLMDS